jgi:hypothetical protein
VVKGGGYTLGVTEVAVEGNCRIDELPVQINERVSCNVVVMRAWFVVGIECVECGSLLMWEGEEA